MKASHSDSVLFRNHLQERTKISDSSIHVYVGSVEKFLKFNPDIDEIDDYNNFLIPLIHRKRSTHYYSAIKRYIEFKIDDGKLRAKLIDALIKPTNKDPITERRHLNDEKILEVINNLTKQKHKVLAIIQTMTGVRAGDILRLRKPQGIFYEDREGKPIIRLNIIGKREKRNVVFIFDPVAQDIIINYIDNNVTHDDYYFLEFSTHRKKHDDTRRLKDMNYHWYWSDLKQALNSAGVDSKDFATHDFRRCFAREIWEKFDHNLVILQRSLNHKQADSTLRYLKHSGLDNKEILFKFQTQ